MNKRKQIKILKNRLAVANFTINMMKAHNFHTEQRNEALAFELGEMNKIAEKYMCETIELRDAECVMAGILKSISEQTK